MCIISLQPKSKRDTWAADAEYLVCAMVIGSAYYLVRVLPRPLTEIVELPILTMLGFSKQKQI
jgi:hypothetical protein